MRKRRISWLDCMPNDVLMPGKDDVVTREELTSIVSALGFPTETGDMRYWEFHGVIPTSIRQRHNDATRAIYPAWMVSVVLRLRELQSVGCALSEITDRLRVELPVLVATQSSVDELKRSLFEHRIKELSDITDGLRRELAALA